MLDIIQTGFDTDGFIARFGDALGGSGLHHALDLLNRTVPYRFTGVYAFEPDWVRSVVLFDRENPHLQIGADVPMKESYCMFTARATDSLIIVDSQQDARFAGHAARDSVLSYIAVLLLDPHRAPLGTLCHFDFCSREVPAGSLDLLEGVREPVQEYLWAKGFLADPATRFT